MGYWLYGNYQLTGSISGALRVPSDKSLAENGRALVDALLTLLPVSLVGYLFSLAVTAGVVFVWAHYWQQLGKKGAAGRWRPPLLLAIAGGIYLMALLVLRTHSQFDNIDVRLVAPAVPLILLLLLLSYNFAAGSRKIELGVLGISVFIMVSLAARGYGQMYSARNNWLKHGSPQLPMVGNLMFNNFTPNPAANRTGEIINKLVDNQGVLIINRPIIWQFIGGIPTIQTPGTLDLSKLKQLNTLPAGSVLVLENSKFADLQKLVAPYAGKIQAKNLGDSVAVKLPISLGPQD